MRITIALAILALTSLPQTVCAQRKPLSPEARRLTEALAELRKSPNDSAAQEHYLKAFPRTYKDFLKTFGYPGELYDGHDYILLLPSLANLHEEEVGNLLIQLGKDGVKEADAPSYLQDATATYAGQCTKTFATLVNRLPRKESAKLIEFLADVENHGAYQSYQDTIDHLKSLGQMRLAMELELARERRSRQPHG